MSEQQQQINGSSDESSAHARRANLFSKWRQRDRVAGTTTETVNNNNIDISASAGSNSIKPTTIPNSPSKRGSAPSLSSVSGAAARAELDIGGSISSSRKSTGSSSRHRSRSRPRDGKSSSSSRNRSKSRGKSSKSEEGESTSTAPTPSRGVEREESLRDYWKRRAEESKERVTTTATGGSGSVHSNNSSSWGEKMNNEDGSNKSSSTSGQHQPPPPPRGSVSSESRGSSSRRTTGSSRARSKSRGRSEKNATSKAPTTPPGRKVDSIASALVGHSHRKSTTQQQLQSTSSSRNLLPQSISVDDNNDKSTEDLQSSSLSPLHQSLATASWSDLYTHLTGLSKIEDKVGLSEIAATLSQPHPKYGGTVLHVASWKAPPALAIQMIRLMPKESREMSVLQGIRDGEGNTPLHLCAGNLDLRIDTTTSSNGGGGEEEKVEIDHLGVLREIVSSTTGDSKPWTAQNSEGDTPLHMLVSSPLCTVESNKSSREPSPTNEVKEKLAKEAITLALSTPEGVEACLLQERTGGTPLHIALASGAHDCVIEALLSASPASARIEDSRGMLPLHWAGAFGKANYSMVKKLVEEYPKALISCTVDGDIPLHLAVSNALLEEDSVGGGRSWEGDNSTRVDKNRLKIVELLMHDHSKKSLTSSKSDSNATATSPILTTNREKLTPLHCCALFDAPPQISKLLMKHPDANTASSMTNSFGATPLHLAAAQPGVSQSIATVLAIGSPDAAAVQDRLKRTPLHVAAQNTYATNLLIKTLSELNPDAASVKTQRGHLPLHLAAQSQAKEAVIRALIKAYPAAAEARNKSNNTPLHDAAKYRASLGVVRLLLDAYPGALYVQNQYGNLPLHCATAYQAPSEVVQLLLKSWPEGASMQNRNQDAPLHYAAAYATSSAAVRPLIEAAPAAVLLLNSSGQSPVDRAKANNAPGDIVRLLESAADEYSRNATSGEGKWASFGGEKKEKGLASF